MLTTFFIFQCSGSWKTEGRYSQDYMLDIHYSESLLTQINTYNEG